MQNLREKIHILMLSTILFLPGCLASCENKVGRYDLQPDIEEVETDLSEIAEGVKKQEDEINKANTDIKTHASQIETKVEKFEEIDAEKFDPHINSIYDDTEIISDSMMKITSLRMELDRSQGKLQAARAKADDMEEDYDKAVQRMQDAEEKAKQMEAEKEQIREEMEKLREGKEHATQEMLRWLIAISIIGVGAGIAVAVFGHFVAGGTIGLGSVVTMALAITVQQYITWIAIGGLVILAGTVAFLIYQFFVREKCIGEMSQAEDLMKKHLPEDVYHNIFGDESVEPGKLSNIESKTTRDMAQKKKKKMNPP